MALPTGRHAALLSLRAKLLKSHIIAGDVGLTKVSNDAFALYTLVDAVIGKPSKAARSKVTEDLEGDEASE